MRQLLVTAGVVIRDDLVMMAQRREGDQEGGKWEFPGGKVEPGEDPRRGLERELREELGIAVTVGRILEVASQTQSDRQLVLLYFACDLDQGEPAALDCQQVGWFTPKQVDSLVKPILDQAFWEQYRWEVRSAK